ncbi:MAG: MerR family transcriptional regulator [Clostridia bacterium]|nr:MerR family transcriptional regulator [Clostridia bacterium]
MNTYTTSDIAKKIGIHPNTVRFYEEMQLITRPERKENGYRIFTDLHIYQFKIARTAFQIELLQNGLRKQSVEIVKTVALGNIDKALDLTDRYLEHIEQEKNNAAEAVKSAKAILENKDNNLIKISMTRKETADYLGITTDTLRNWELNGLLRIKRRQNGYRVYTEQDIQILKIIRSLRCANYSLSSILRMLTALSRNPQTDIMKVIDTPLQTDDIITACDRLITSLDRAAYNDRTIKNMLIEMKEKFFNSPI